MDGAGGPTPGQDGVGLPQWDAQLARPQSTGAAPVLSVAGFEGPLDWLLELVRARRIDLARLSITALVDAFAAALLAALAEAGQTPLTLARWGDWLVMAADLALLRSRLLVPDEAATITGLQDAQAWRTRLLSRAAMRVAADWLERRDQVGRDVFTRGLSAKPGAGRTQRALPATLDVTALLRACLVALRLPADAASRYRVPAAPLWSVADASVRIRALLPAMAEAGAPLAGFLPKPPAALPDPERWCRLAVASTFMASLELAREGSIAFQQEDVWEPIWIGLAQEPPAGRTVDQVS